MAAQLRRPSADGGLIRTGTKYLMNLVNSFGSKYAVAVTFKAENLERDALRYTVTFSSPKPEGPVPIAEAHVHFLLSVALLEKQNGAAAELQGGEEEAKSVPTFERREKVQEENEQVLFWFENQNVKHSLKHTLRPEKFEKWIDRIIEAKHRLREASQLRTPFEATRMEAGLQDIDDLLQDHKVACLLQETEAEKAAYAAATREALAAAATELAPQADRQKSCSIRGQLTPRMLYEAPPEELCLEEVLQKVLNAADEDREGKLSHKTVAGVLSASPLGLQRWDLALLLAGAAQEDRDGYIHYKSFIEQAPDIIRRLRQRRKAASQCICPERVTDDAVLLLYKDEMEETWRVMRDLFEAADEGAATTGKLSRGKFLECLQSRPERLALRETTLLMQIAPTDDEGLVDIHAFPVMLRILRRESINHAVLETSTEDLKKEILHAVHKVGFSELSLIPLWTLREILNVTQLCLTRAQIHALLCMLEFDRVGHVRCDHFVQTVCEVIPPLFDSALFMKQADCVARELADAAARAELEELQGLTGGGKSKRKPSNREGNDTSQHGRHDSYDDAEKGEAPDKETVEKTLIHLFTVVDEKRRGTIPLQTFISAMRYWTTSSTHQQNTKSTPAGVARQQQDQQVVAGSTAKAGAKAGIEGNPPPSNSPATTADLHAAKSSRRPAAGGALTRGATPPPTAVVSVGSNPASGSAAAAAERRYADVVASCKLTVEEVTGLIAEVEVGEYHQEVAYHEHIKTWIPTVFEIRRSPIFYQLIHHRGDSNARSKSSVVHVEKRESRAA